MDRRRLLAGVVSVLLVGMGAVQAQDIPSGELELLIHLEVEGDATEQPSVDCSDGRPDRDCLSGRLGSDQTTQTCNGLATVFGAGNCMVHCRDGYYACGKCGFAGFAMCTCRENFTCNPYTP